tara:strand:- start:489 stop:680 length:192 start_codon:yes stop_codon:yes gene_type:complete
MFEDIFKKFQNFILLIFHTVVSFFKKSKKEGFNILEKFNIIEKCKRLFISERAEHSMKRRLFH